MCGVPFVAAPELFAEYNDPGGWTQCYVKRQPANATELDHMVNAISQAELGCIRYKGRGEEIQRRLVQIGEVGQCDQLLPQYKEWYQLERSQPQRKAGRLLRTWWHRLLRLVGKHDAL